MSVGGEGEKDEMEKTQPALETWHAVCLDEETDCWIVPEAMVSAGSDGDFPNAANAHLMAASPDLLRALRGLCDHLLFACESYDEYLAITRDATQAIAKAEPGGVQWP